MTKTTIIAYPDRPDQLLTWLDVERVLKRRLAVSQPSTLPVVWATCYADGADIGYQGSELSALQWLESDVFGAALFDASQGLVRLAPGDAAYPIRMEPAEIGEAREFPTYPLWREVAYVSQGHSSLPEPWPDAGPRVTAFHSFKGGVGRTTALVTYLAATLAQRNEQSARVLVIDADLEAPGISFWLDDSNRPRVSFVQFLEALHYPPKDVASTLDYFSSELRKTSLSVDGSQYEVFVLPSMLEIGQLMDMPVRPEHLARNPENPWQLSDHIRQLGIKLGVSNILIDLRAGLSELSGPLLFDQRIERMFVTTIARQSVEGLSQILKRVHALRSKQTLQAATAKPTIIRTMLTTQSRLLPDYFRSEEQLGQAFPASTPAEVQDVMASGVEWLECDFSESLMNLRNLREAIQQVRVSSTLYPEACLWADALIGPTTAPSMVDSVESQSRRLRELCNEMQFAEHAATERLLVTEPLRNLGRSFTHELPNAVSVGAKGAGKTFTYLQLCRAEKWERFLQKVRADTTSFPDTPIFPIMWSEQLRGVALDVVINAYKAFHDGVGAQLRPFSYEDNVRRIKEGLRTSTTSWDQIWVDFICWQMGSQVNSLHELNLELGAAGRRVVLLIDGIEDIFDSPTEPVQREAIRALLGLQRSIAELRDRHLGLILFIRADYVQIAIRQNLAHFLAGNSRFSLEWTPESFLRLTYWLCAEASIISADASRAEQLPLETLKEDLYRLWGRKLGTDVSKEARSAPWVFGTLCDLKGRFQARDLVRFLRVASDQQLTLGEGRWHDRVLSPEAMRRAVPLCSREKVDEAAVEISMLREWKSSLASIAKEQRKVPFNPLVVGLNDAMLAALVELGVIYEDTDSASPDERFFVPEIYREGLGLESSMAGRPRTLALLRKNLPKLPF